MPPTSEIPLLCFLCFFLAALFLLFLTLLPFPSPPRSSSIILMASASDRLGRYSRLAIHSSARLSSHRSLRTRPWQLYSSSPMAAAGAPTTAKSFPLPRPEKTARPLLNCALRLDTATSIWACLCLSSTSSPLASARSSSSFFRQSSSRTMDDEAAGGALSLTLDSLLALELPLPLPPPAYRSPKTSTACRTDRNGREVSTSARLRAVASMTMSEDAASAGD
jgi:hypothetical protein